MSNQPMQPLVNPFLFSNHEVRTAVGADGKVWFCAKDVYEALDIDWKGSGTSLRNMPQEWVCPLYLRGQRGSGEVVFLSEPAVYRVLFRSNKPQATAFANWVCAEVLPAIRRQGFYGRVPAAQRLGFSRQIAALTRELAGGRDAFHRRVLLDELRTLHTLVGQRLPDLALLGQDPKQIPLGDL